MLCVPSRQPQVLMRTVTNREDVRSVAISVNAHSNELTRTSEDSNRDDSNSKECTVGPFCSPVAVLQARGRGGLQWGRSEAPSVEYNDEHCRRWVAPSVEYNDEHCRRSVAPSVEYNDEHFRRSVAPSVEYNDEHCRRWVAPSVEYSDEHCRRSVALSVEYSNEHCRRWVAQVSSTVTNIVDVR